MQSPWETLGVTRESSQEEIKKAYKKLALKYHPDRNPGDKNAEDKFKEITAAYEAITSGNADGHSNAVTEDILNDIFSQFGFGGFPGFRQSKQGTISVTPISLSVKELCLGAKKTTIVATSGPCQTCSGVGAAQGNYSDCTVCRGSGKNVFRQGFVTVSMGSCQACSGVGRTISKKCEDCSGTGNKTSNTDITIDIPPGANNGNISTVIFGNRVPIPIYLEKDQDLTLEGQNIRSRITIDLRTALFGGKVTVDTIKGQKTVNIDPLKFGDAELRLRGLGVQTQSPGDHLLDVRVIMPDEDLRKKIKGAIDE